MNATTNRNWDEANYRYLSADLAVVRSILENHTAKEQNQSVENNLEHLQQALQETAAAMPAPSALERICKIFSLSSFESDLLLLCAGMELNGEFAKLCAIAHGDLQRAYPTLSLAMAALSNVHWDAIAPNSPLRHWRLIQIGDGHSLTLSPVRIDERILHYLTGIQYLDERLTGIIEPLQEVNDLVPSHQDLAERISAVWSQVYKVNSLPIVQLCSSETTSKRAIPADTPTADLDALQLARLNVAGGNIRNIALNAAFLAADAGEAVQMKHVLRAAQTEYSKLEKPLTDAEVGGWM